MPGPFVCSCGRSYSNNKNRVRHQRTPLGAGHVNADAAPPTSQPHAGDGAPARAADTLAQGAPAAGVGDESPFSPHEEVPGGGSIAEAPAPAPSSGPRGLFDRLRSRGGHEREPKAPRARRLMVVPGPSRSRRPLTPMLEGVIDWAGRRMERAGMQAYAEGRYGDAPITASVPVGRSFALVAPVAAELGDNALSGTVIDRIAQPFVARGEELEKVWKILRLPVLVGIAERQPAMLAVRWVDSGAGDGTATIRVEGPLAQELYDSVETLLLESATVIRKKERKREDGLKRIREAYPDLHEAGVDPIMQKIAEVFAPPGAEAEPGPAAAHAAAAS